MELQAVLPSRARASHQAVASESPDPTRHFISDHFFGETRRFAILFTCLSSLGADSAPRASPLCVRFPCQLTAL